MTTRHWLAFAAGFLLMPTFFAIAIFAPMLGIALFALFGCSVLGAMAVALYQHHVWVEEDQRRLAAVPNSPPGWGALEATTPTKENTHDAS